MAKVGRPAKPEPDKVWAVAPDKIPDMPKEMSGEAAIEYARMAPYLLALKRVSDLDRQSLAVYCMYWGEFVRLYNSEFSDPWVKLYADGPKCDVMHPGLPPLLRYATTIIRIAGHFGMTPRTRELCGDHNQRKSAALKLLEGNRKKIAQSRLEASVIRLSDYTKWPDEHVAPPDWMGHDARDEYEQLGKVLDALDMFTPLDRTPLVIGCCLFELFLRANTQMTELYTQHVVTRKVGDGEYEEDIYDREHPLHKVQDELYQVLNRIWKDYGQTARYRRIFEGEVKPEKNIPMTFKGKFAQ